MKSWYESHVGDHATELQSGKAEPIHADALQPMPTCKSSLLKTQLIAAASAPVCQPFLSDHQRRRRQLNFGINLQMPSFPINDVHITQTLGKSVGFSFTLHAMCVLAVAQNQFNFMLQTSASCVRQKSKGATSLIHGVWDRLPVGQSTNE